MSHHRPPLSFMAKSIFPILAFFEGSTRVGSGVYMSKVQSNMKTHLLFPLKEKRSLQKVKKRKAYIDHITRPAEAFPFQHKESQLTIYLENQTPS